MHLLWPAGSDFAICLVVLILVLGGWAVIRGLRHKVVLTRELVDIYRVEFKLDQWEKESIEHNGEEAVNGQDSGSDAVNNEQESRPTPDLRLRPSELDARLRELESWTQYNGHMRQRIVAIRRLRAHQVKVNLDTLQQLAWAEERTRNGIDTPRQIAGWVMILGVVGTFIGLSDMVQQIQVRIPEEHIAIDQISNKLQEFKGILQGMRTAFSTSVVGMLVALLAGAIAHQVQALQSNVFSVLETLTVGKLIPASVSSLGDDSVLERISIQMEQAFSHLESVTEQNLNSMREFSISHKVLQVIVEDVQKILESESRQDVRAVIDRIVETNSLVAQLVDKMPDIVLALSATNKELSTGLATLDKTVRTRPVINTEQKSGFMVITSRGLAAVLLVAVGWAVVATFYLK